MPDGNPAVSKKTSTSEWYAGGLKFQCSQCGNCCTGPAGYVWFTEAEGKAMAEELGLSKSAFYEKYARREGTGWSLKEHKTEHGYDCVFLDRESIRDKAVCLLYKSRPTQCRTWPFWPENLKTKKSWETVKSETPCPGMGNGNLVPIEDIRFQRDELIP